MPKKKKYPPTDVTIVLEKKLTSEGLVDIPPKPDQEEEQPGAMTFGKDPRPGVIPPGQEGEVPPEQEGEVINVSPEFAPDLLPEIPDKDLLKLYEASEANEILNEQLLEQDEETGEVKSQVENVIPDGELDPDRPVMNRGANLTISALEKLIPEPELQAIREAGVMGSDALKSGARIIGGSLEDSLHNSLRWLYKLTPDSFQDVFEQTMFGQKPGVLGTTGTEAEFEQTRLFPHMGGVLEEVARGISTFAWGMKGAGIILNTKKLFVLRGAMADMAVFNPELGTLATLMRDMDWGPEVLQDLAAYIDSTEPGTETEKRLRMAVEGIILAGVLTGAMKSPKAMRELNEWRKTFFGEDGLGRPAIDKVAELFRELKKKWDPNRMSFEEYLTKQTPDWRVGKELELHGNWPVNKPFNRYMAGKGWERHPDQPNKIFKHVPPDRPRWGGPPYHLSYYKTFPSPRTETGTLVFPRRGELTPKGKVRLRGEDGHERLVDDFKWRPDPDTPHFGLPPQPQTLPPGHRLLKHTHTIKTAARERLRKKIVKNAVKGAVTVKDRKPVAFLKAGGAASGKGAVDRLLRKEKSIKPGVTEVNADTYKAQLPEWKKFIDAGDARGANILHEESSDLVGRVTDELINKNADVVFDRVLGNPKKAKALIKKLHAAGYEVRLVGATVDPREAVIRAIARYTQTKRWVEISELLRGHKNVSTHFDEYMDMVDTVHLYDNVGKEPREIVWKTGGKVEMLDEKSYNEFVKKGDVNEKADTLNEILPEPYSPGLADTPGVPRTDEGRGLVGDGQTPRSGSRGPEETAALAEVTSPHTATIEISTTKTLAQKEAEGLYESYKATVSADPDNKQAVLALREYDLHVVQGLRQSARGKDNPFEKTVRAIIGEEPKRKILTGLETPPVGEPYAVGGFYRDAVGNLTARPNVRVPIPSLTPDQRKIFNAIIGRAWKQEAMASAQIKAAQAGAPVAKGGHRIYSIFVPTTEKLGKDDSVWAALHQALPDGIDIIFTKKPNGYRIDVLPNFSGGADASIQEVLDAAKKIFPTQKAEVSAADYFSAQNVDYFNVKNAPRVINKFKKELEQDAIQQLKKILGSEEEARRYLAGEKSEVAEKLHLGDSKKATGIKSGYRGRIDSLSGAEQSAKQVSKDYRNKQHEWFKKHAATEVTSSPAIKQAKEKINSIIAEMAETHEPVEGYEWFIDAGKIRRLHVEYDHAVKELEDLGGTPPTRPEVMAGGLSLLGLTTPETEPEFQVQQAAWWSGFKKAFKPRKPINVNPLDDASVANEELKRFVAQHVDANMDNLDARSLDDIIEEAKTLRDDPLNVDPSTWDNSAMMVKVRLLAKGAALDAMEKIKKAAATGDLDDIQAAKNAEANMANLLQAQQQLQAGPARTTMVMGATLDPSDAIGELRAKNFTKIAINQALEVPDGYTDLQRYKIMAEATKHMSAEEWAVRAKDIIGWKDLFLAHMYPFMLSSLGTWGPLGANVLSNSLILLNYPMTKLAGAALSPVRRMFNNDKDRITWAEGFRSMAVLRQSLPESLRFAWETLLTNQPAGRQVTKLDQMYHASKGDDIVTADNLREMFENIHQNPAMKDAWFQKLITPKTVKEGGPFAIGAQTWGLVLSGPGRGLKGGDEFFKTFGRRLGQLDEAYRKAFRDWESGAINQGEIDEAVTQYLKNPTKKMNKAGEELAEFLTLQTKLGEFGELMSKARDTGIAQWGLPWGRMTMPFMKVMVNLGKYSLHMVNLTGKTLDDLKGLNGGAAQDMALGRFVVAGTYVTIAQLLSTGFWDNVQLHGYGASGAQMPDPEDNKAMKEMEMNAGFKPCSLVITDEDGGRHTVQFGQIEPLATFFCTVADISDNSEEIMEQLGQAEYDKLMMTAYAIMSNNLISKQWARSVHELLTLALTPTDRSARALDNFVRIVVPRILADFRTAAGDDEFREYQHAVDGFNGTWEVIKSQLPGLSKTLPGKKNIWNEPVFNHGKVGPDWLSVFRYSHTKPDIVDKEAYRLKIPMRNVSWRVEGVKLHPQVRNRWIELANPIERKAGEWFGKSMTKKEVALEIKGQAYAAADEDERVERLKRIINKRRNAAKKQLFNSKAPLDPVIAEWQPDLLTQIAENKERQKRVQEGVEGADYFNQMATPRTAREPVIPVFK